MTAYKFYKLLTILIVMASTGCKTNGNIQNQKGLSIELSIPVNDMNERVLDLNKKHAKVYVLFKNNGTNDLRLWKNQCSWGYFTVHFVFDPENGKTNKLEKKIINWTVNAPTYWVLHPGETFVWEENIHTEEWNIPNNFNGKISLNAIYEVEADNYAKEYKIWTGKLETESLDVQVYPYQGVCEKIMRFYLSSIMPFKDLSGEDYKIAACDNYRDYIPPGTNQAISICSDIIHFKKFPVSWKEFKQRFNVDKWAEKINAFEIRELGGQIPVLFSLDQTVLVIDLTPIERKTLSVNSFLYIRFNKKINTNDQRKIDITKIDDDNINVEECALFLEL